jgi:hypothetical protein
MNHVAQKQDPDRCPQYIIDLIDDAAEAWAKAVPGPAASPQWDEAERVRQLLITRIEDMICERNDAIQVLWRALQRREGIQS